VEIGELALRPPGDVGHVESLGHRGGRFQACPRRVRRTEPALQGAEHEQTLRLIAAVADGAAQLKAAAGQEHPFAAPSDQAIDRSEIAIVVRQSAPGRHQRIQNQGLLKAGAREFKTAVRTIDHPQVLVDGRKVKTVVIPGGDLQRFLFKFEGLLRLSQTKGDQSPRGVGRLQELVVAQAGKSLQGGVLMLQGFLIVPHLPEHVGQILPGEGDQPALPLLPGELERLLLTAQGRLVVPHLFVGDAQIVERVNDLHTRRERTEESQRALLQLDGRRVVVPVEKFDASPIAQGAPHAHGIVDGLIPFIGLVEKAHGLVILAAALKDQAGLTQ